MGTSTPNASTTSTNDRREPLIEVRNVSKWFGRGERRIIALERVNLKIYPGEFVTLLGPSGCGKSTLLRIITGLAQPSEGEVLYRGQPLRGVNPHATIVFQSFALYPWLTVQGNVEAALKARGVPAEERHQRALALIDKVGLDGFENAYPANSPAGCARRWVSPAPWPLSRSYCAWTNPSRRWTCSLQRACAGS